MASGGLHPKVSIVIATRNRRPEVLTAIESAVAQDYSPLEVLVYDDHSADGTASAIRQRFPEVRVVQQAVAMGYIVCRNRALHDATGDYIFSLDDDAYFTSRHTITHVVTVFKADPSVAAVALAYIEPYSTRPHHMSAMRTWTQLRNYIGCAHAIRRKCALDVGGYRELLVHQGEERDLCLRLHEKGLKIVFANTPPIVHLYSSKRDQRRLNHYGYRNTLLITSLNVPHPYVIPRMIVDSVQLLKHRFRLRNTPRTICAIIVGWITSWRYRKHRNPVSRNAYKKFRSLMGHGPLAWNGVDVPMHCKREAFEAVAIEQNAAVLSPQVGQRSESPS